MCREGYVSLDSINAEGTMQGNFKTVKARKPVCSYDVPDFRCSVGVRINLEINYLYENC